MAIFALSFTKLNYKINKYIIGLPFVVAVAISSGILIGATLFNNSQQKKELDASLNKFREVIGILENDYVDTLDPEKVTEFAISKILERLDPHSNYIPLSDLELSKASLESDFEGVGVEFLIVNDTVQVISALNGGPSELVGILPGDRITGTDGRPFTGNHINNREVFNRLRGPKGTKIVLEITRTGISEKLKFTVTRSTISSQSVEAAFLIKPEIGYLKLSRFSDNTFVECHQKLSELKAKGAKSIILDLRDNPGGYLDRATKLADEFLQENKLIVYTNGKNSKYNQKYYSTSNGLFEDEPLIVLVNEGSASASEIIAGAIQDNDRGLIVGRRTFGKGLVQVPISLKDGSELRLTISRYFTPSGRSIQKEYKSDIDLYDREMEDRFYNGELFHRDSIIVKDFQKFETLLGRKVQGGGGITPDLFVPLDTLFTNSFLIKLMQQNLFREYALTYYSKNKIALNLFRKRSGPKSLSLNSNAWIEFVNLVAAKKIEWPISKQRIETERYITYLLKAYIARLVWGDQGFYELIIQKDPAVISSLNHLMDAQKLLIASRKKTNS